MSTLHVSENNPVIVNRLYRFVENVLWLFIVLAIAGNSFADAKGEELFQELQRTLSGRSSSPSFDAKCSVDRFDKKPKREYQLAWDGQFMLQSVVKNSAGGGIETSVKNSDYFFTLHQSGDSKSIVALEELANSSSREKVERFIENSEPLVLILAGVEIAGTPVEEFITSPRFELLRMFQIGDGRIQMDFRYEMDEAEEYPFAYERSSVVFDRQKNWCIVEGDWHVEKGKQRNKQHLVRKLTVGPVSMGIPLVNGVYDTLNDLPFMAFEAEISLDPIDKSRFYLSHYGFPEPTFRRNFWPWVGGSLFLLAIAFAAHRMWKRR